MLRTWIPSLSHGQVGGPFVTSRLPPLSAVSGGEKGNPNPSRMSRGMALANENPEASGGGNVWNLCRMPFWQAGGSGSSSSSAAAGVSHHHVIHGHAPRSAEGSDTQYSGASGSVSSVAKSLLLTRRRLRLDPASKLYFPCEFVLLIWLDFFFIACEVYKAAFGVFWPSCLS